MSFIIKCCRPYFSRSPCYCAVPIGTLHSYIQLWRSFSTAVTNRPYTLGLCASRNISLFFFFTPCLQHSRAPQCADTIISYSKPLPQLYPHIQKKKRGRENRQQLICIHLPLQDVCNFQCQLGGFNPYSLCILWMSWWASCLALLDLIQQPPCH